MCCLWYWFVGIVGVNPLGCVWILIGGESDGFVIVCNGLVCALF